MDLSVLGGTSTPFLEELTLRNTGDWPLDPLALYFFSSSQLKASAVRKLHLDQISPNTWDFTGTSLRTFAASDCHHCHHICPPSIQQLLDISQSTPVLVDLDLRRPLVICPRLCFVDRKAETVALRRAHA